MIRRSKRNGTHRQRCILVTDRRPSCSRVRGTPNAAHGAANEDGVAGRVRRINGNGGDAAGDRRKETAGGGSGTDGIPCGGDGTERRKNRSGSNIGGFSSRRLPFGGWKTLCGGSIGASGRVRGFLRTHSHAKRQHEKRQQEGETKIC